MQQTTFFHTNPSSNNVFWSLSYEFWYYVFFGCAVYLDGWKRVFSLLLVSIVMGAHILLLFPVWLLGVLAFYTSRRFPLQNKVALPSFFISLLVLAWLFMTKKHLLPSFGHLGFPPLGYSADFANDFLIGLVLAFNLYALSQITFTYSISNSPIYKIAKYLSVATFPLYTLHYPLLIFIKVVVPYDIHNVWHVFFISMSIILLVLLANHFFEKTRPYYVRAFSLFINSGKKLLHEAR